MALHFCCCFNLSPGITSRVELGGQGVFHWTNYPLPLHYEDVQVRACGCVCVSVCGGGGVRACMRVCARARVRE